MWGNGGSDDWCRQAKKCKFMENKTGNLKKKDNTTLLALL